MKTLLVATLVSYTATFPPTVGNMTIKENTFYCSPTVNCAIVMNIEECFADGVHWKPRGNMCWTADEPRGWQYLKQRIEGWFK